MNTSGTFMNSHARLGILFRIAAVAETPVALALVVDPSGVASILLRSGLDGPAQVIGRIAGGALLSVGVACWYARNATATPAGIGVAWGLLAYNVVTCVALAVAVAAIPGGGLVALGASVLHGLFAGALLAALLRPGPALTRV